MSKPGTIRDHKTTPPYKPAFKERKFRELVLYLADKAVQDDEKTYDEVKLQKLLWIADSLAYVQLGEPITGATYIRKARGPVASEYLKQSVILIDAKELAPQRVARNGKELQRDIALKPADLMGFSPQEVDIANLAVSAFHEIDSRELSEWSHGFRGWRSAQHDAVIPYEMFYLEDDEPPAELVEYAKQVVVENQAAWGELAHP